MGRGAAEALPPSSLMNCLRKKTASSKAYPPVSWLPRPEVEAGAGSWGEADTLSKGCGALREKPKPVRAGGFVPS